MREVYELVYQLHTGQGLWWLGLLLGLFGAARVALGSDYPFPLGEAHAGALVESMTELSAADKARILAGSAQEFLGLV